MITADTMLKELTRWNDDYMSREVDEAIDHLRSWLRIQKDEEDKLNRASFFARYCERPQ